MVKLAVIGRDVSKSASPPIHNFIAREMGKQISYGRVTLPEDRFDKDIERILNEYDGFNVTIPYKIAIIPKLNAICGDALSFGAVNTVLSATRTGYNTDGEGFAYMLRSNGVDVSGKSALVLGAGGAGRSAVKKLLDGGAEVEVYNRTFKKAQALESEFSGVKAVKSVEVKDRYLIVNATGVGMHESVGVSPADKEIISRCEVAADLIYEPPQSEFLSIAKSLGKQTVNGFAMLFYQAYYADCIYFGVQPDGAQATALFKKYSKEIGQ